MEGEDCNFMGKSVKKNGFWGKGRNYELFLGSNILHEIYKLVIL
jgi:hypothetical protein